MIVTAPSVSGDLIVTPDLPTVPVITEQNVEKKEEEKVGPPGIFYTLTDLWMDYQAQRSNGITLIGENLCKPKESILIVRKWRTVGRSRLGNILLFDNFESGTISVPEDHMRFMVIWMRGESEVYQRTDQGWRWRGCDDEVLAEAMNSSGLLAYSGMTGPGSLAYKPTYPNYSGYNGGGSSPNLANPYYGHGGCIP